MGKGSPVTWKNLAITLAIFGSIVVYFVTNKNKRTKEAMKKHTRTLGTASLGGKWTLVDHNGKPFTDAMLRGKLFIFYI